MAVVELADDLFIIRGLVNVYLLRTLDGIVLLDTGFPNSSTKILDGVRSLGLAPNDVRNILITHAHPDHIGSVGALQRETGATVWAHPIDAPIIQAGQGFRSVKATPGLINGLVTRFLLGRVKSVDPARVDNLIEDGDHLPFLPDLQAVHAPGHCAGQIAFYWQRHGGVLFTADTCVNILGISLPSACEDLALARQSLERLKTFRFEKICFMHGSPIRAGGDAAFKRVEF